MYKGETDGVNERFEPAGVRAGAREVGVREKDDFDPFQPPPK